MAEYSLGKVGFERLENGDLSVGQHWNPHLIPRADRESIAGILREIASEIEQDRFENQQKYRFYKAPLPVRK